MSHAFSQNTRPVVMDVDDLKILVIVCCIPDGTLTLAWFDSSRVRDRRLTSGRFTAPNVVPRLTYLTRASLTM